MRQSPACLMQFMLTVYESAEGPARASPPEVYPRVFAVERFRGWRPASGPGARPPAWPPAPREGPE